jgi:hypothetical protein
MENPRLRVRSIAQSSRGALSRQSFRAVAELLAYVYGKAGKSEAL